MFVQYFMQSSLNRTPSKDILDSGSSSEEEEIVDDVHVNQYLGKGKIVLEGFLMKKVVLIDSVLSKAFV